MRPSLHIRLVALVLLGALASLAVAWGCALWCDRAVSLATLDTEDWVYRELTVSERTMLDASGWQPRPAMMISSRGVGSMQPGASDMDRPPPPRARTRSVAGFERRLIIENDVLDDGGFGATPWLFGRSVVAVHVRAGWPLRCMSGEHSPDQNNAGAAARTKRAWLISLAGPITRGDPATRFIPLAIEWPRLLINTLFFAAAIGLMWLGLRMLLRRARLERALCPRCRYPIGASPRCSECGETVPETCLAPVVSMRTLRRLAVISVVLCLITSPGLALVCALWSPILNPDASRTTLPRERWWASPGGSRMPDRCARGLGFEQNLVQSGSWSCAFIRAGWPWSAFQGSIETWKSPRGPSPSLAHHARFAPAWLAAGDDAATILPTRVMWSGVITNAIAHALLLFAIGVATTWWWGRRRRQTPLTIGV